MGSDNARFASLGLPESVRWPAAQFGTPGRTLAQMEFSQLWRLTNLPRSFNPGQVRLGCGIFVVAMGIIAIVFHRPDQQVASWLRCSLIAYSALGFAFATRMTWGHLRAFLVGLAFLLPLEALYASYLPRDPLFNLALVGMATFFPFLFLLSGIDVVLVAVGLTTVHVILLASAPPPHIPLSAAIVVLGGSVAAGAAVGLILTISMAGAHASMTWWHHACDRERLLREFNEIAASRAELPELSARFAQDFAKILPGGRCLLFLADAAAVYRVAACAGVRADRAEWIEGKELPGGLASMLAPALNARELVVRSPLGAAERTALSVGFPSDFFGSIFIALPVVVEERVGGVAVLTAADGNGVGIDDVLLLQSMVSQVGITVARSQLLAQLHAALDAKSEFVNTMSHELRSPLNVVIGYADILLEGELDPKFVGTRVRDSGLELLQLVENSLTVARLGTGKLKVNLEEFSVQRLLMEVAEAVSSLPEGRKGIEVEWTIDPGLPRVELDRLKLKEIFQNLISNALKYTDAGRVMVRVKRHDDQLHIEVEDTGRGIPNEAQARIFEMFERVETVNDSPPPGIGLGLYIVKNLVDLMNGTIHLVSRPGEGSCFTVSLGVRLDAKVAESKSTRRGTPRPPAIGYAS